MSSMIFLGNVFGGPHAFLHGQRVSGWCLPEPTLRSRYLHFTTRELAATVVASGRLDASELELRHERGVFAVPVGGTWRAAQLANPAEVAVLAVADALPDWCLPTEAAWKVAALPLRRAELLELEAARVLLDGRLRRLLRGDDGQLHGAPAGYRPLPASPLAAIIPDPRGLFGVLTSHEPGRFAACCSLLHGTTHWRQVAAAGLVAARQTAGADIALVFCFAMLHDAFRQDDGPDPEHGRRGAEALERLCADDWLRLDGRQHMVLFEALVDHPHGRTSLDPTIGCCWDADRLDLPRVGVRVDPALLSTVAGRAQVEQVFEDPRVEPPSWRALWAAYADDVYGKR